MKLKVQEDTCVGNMAGHLTVIKTYDRVLQNFFWPGLKQDVKKDCKTCQVCQFNGKLNQVVLVVLLHISAFDERLSRVLVVLCWSLALN